MVRDGKILCAVGETPLELLPRMSNRHGVIAGATGTGKTVTMKVLAEGFSEIGVPVFFSDVKGDLTGTCLPGKAGSAIAARLETLGIPEESFHFQGYPVRFWDIFGTDGCPIRVTVSGLGPVLLARMLDLTEVQTGCLSVVFRIADEHGLLLLDLKDLRAMISYVAENRKEFSTEYGLVTTASLNAVQRALLTFEEEGGGELLGEPAFDIRDWIRTDTDGRGFINILSSGRLIRSPRVYAAFLMWLVSELYEKLPEIGDPEKPRMVFFFDEAHLLFEGAPKALVQKLEQVVRLIRSKGVGVYFVTQSPSDIPDAVLAQLNNRIQHGLRAYTPAEQRRLKAASEAFRVNPAFDTKEALAALGTGEALISFLGEDGVPSIVQRATVLPPQSLLGAADPETIAERIRADEFDLKYREPVDRESAYELICKAREVLEEEKQAGSEKAGKRTDKTKGTSRKKKTSAEKAATSAMSTVAGALGRNIVNSITGGKTTGTGTILKRAASNALSSVMRSASTSIFRGIFGQSK